MGKKPGDTKPIKAKPVPIPGEATTAAAATTTAAPAPAATPTPSAQAAPAPIVEVDPISLLPESIETKALSSFSIEIDEISAFKAMIDVVSYLVDELLFAFTHDALHFTAIDSSHVAMIAVTLLKEYFAEWKISAPCVFNTDVSDFLKIIKRANASDTVRLRYDGNSSKTDKIAAKYVEIVMENGKSKRKFKIKGKDIDSGFTNGMEIDNALKFVRGFLEKSGETRVRFKISVAAISEIVKDANLISDIVTLASKKDTKTVIFNAIGDSGDYEIELVSKDKSDIKDFQADIDTETIYSLSFIENILKMNALCTEVTITSIERGPMLFDFQIVKGGKAVGNLLYLIAPRAIDDDMDIEEVEDETAPDLKANEEDGAEKETDVEGEDAGEEGGEQ